MERSLTNEETIELTERFSAHHYTRYPLVLDRGKGCRLGNDENQTDFLDMIAGYSAVIFGRSGEYYDRVVSVLINQAQKLALVTGSYYTEPYTKFCSKLAEFCSMDKVLAMNTGAEAVETAMKIAKRWAYRTKGVPRNSAGIISCYNNFHGRTQGVLSLSTEEAYRKDFGPLLPGCLSIPFGNINALESVINKNTAAFIVEPIQGEGGINIPPDDYLTQAERVCKKNNTLFVLDEIQTGFGRTGMMFAHQAFEAKPDLLILGKALGGGLLPISAVVGRKDVMSVLDPGSHGSTFGGNPLACAVACEVLDILKENPFFVRKAWEVGEYFLRKLEKLKSHTIKEVRGSGLLIGVELHPLLKTDYYRGRLLEKRILCGIAHEHTLRFSPPLIVTKEEIDWALPKIESVLNE
ncbi:MAG: ornithine--oxo-acid transaminase [Candidatus Yanofskybacteria bacterium]|nr:ornithine--oxo-acid transaminase [Candidatus Yanofskybacteria bacterium]